MNICLFHCLGNLQRELLRTRSDTFETAREVISLLSVEAILVGSCSELLIPKSVFVLNSTIGPR